MLDNQEIGPNDIFSTPTIEPETTLESEAVEETATSGEAEDNTEAETEETTDTDQSDSEEPSVDDVELIYEINGKEVTQKELNEWEDSHKRVKSFQADYTKKTQLLADDRKQFATQKQQLDTSLQTLSGIVEGLQQEILGDLNKVNWDELREYDTAGYLKQKEIVEQKKGRLAELAKQHNDLVQAQALQESQQLHQVLGWADQAKKDADIKTIQDYAKAKGIEDSVANVRDHKVMLALLDAAKYQALQQKKPGVLKQVKAAPKVVTKPSKQAPPEPPKSAADLFYSKS